MLTTATKEQAAAETDGTTTQVQVESIQPGIVELTGGGSGAPVNERERRIKSGIDWPIALWVGALHVGALMTIFYTTWQAVVIAVVLTYLSSCIGITLGYHRLFTHKSFETYKPIRWFIAFCGGLAGEGSAIHWVANHRKHHAMSDQEGDPHTPNDGKWWSHMFWFLFKMSPEDYEAYNKRWAHDLVKDPVLNFLDRTFLAWHFVLGWILLLTGTAIGGWDMGWSFMWWGIFLRLVYVMHITWMINSATHLWGYRNYETTDNSRNLWWVALLSHGEGWHNNHHAHPRSARHGHKWWEFDLTFQIIRVMKWTGLAWNVKTVNPELEQTQSDIPHPEPSENVVVSPGPAQTSCASAV